MQTTKPMLEYTSRLGLVALLALGASDHGSGSVVPKVELLSQVAQYCVPPDDDPNSYRRYCRRDAAKPYRSEAGEPAKNMPTITIARQMQ
jgi:hypothetical protein